MAIIKLMCFGNLKEIVDSDLKFEAENSDELLNHLTEKFPELEDLKLRIAVNQRIISENTELKNNDVVALMPPYSGG